MILPFMSETKFPSSDKGSEKLQMAELCGQTSVRRRQCAPVEESKRTHVPPLRAPNHMVNDPERDALIKQGVKLNHHTILN